MKGRYKGGRGEVQTKKSREGGDIFYNTVS